VKALGPNILITHQIPIIMYRGSRDSDIAKTHSKTATENTPG